MGSLLRAAACLLAAGPAAASMEPLNLAVGGVQPAPMTADLLRVYERPDPTGQLPQSLRALEVVTSAAWVGGPPLPDIVPGHPVAIERSRLKGSEYLAEGLGEGFQAVPWEGVFTKGPAREQAIAGLAETLRAEYAREPGRPINLVCHSHGCGIALEALARVEPDGVRVAKLVSVGTRLTGLPGDNRRDKPANVGDWINIHSRHDQALSAALEGEGILNAEFTGGDRHPHLGVFTGHGLYYENPELREAIRGLVSSPRPAEAVLRERYAGVLELPPERRP